jgi:molecular chaperone DnaK
VTIHVLQGEREFAEHNKSLGRFDLVGLPAAPRGMPQIEVTFDIDANGLVHVGAKDLGTGKEQSIKITASGGLTEAEIKKMQQEAEEHKAEDEERKKLVNARNQLDSMIYSIEKTVKESGDKVPAEEKEKVEVALTEARKFTTSQVLAEIEKATTDLTTASNKMAEILYKNAGAGAAGAEGAGADGGQGGAGAQAHADGANGAGAEAGKKDEDVIDADYKQV